MVKVKMGGVRKICSISIEIQRVSSKRFTYRFMVTVQVKIQILLYYNETVIVKTCRHKNFVFLFTTQICYHSFLLEKIHLNSPEARDYTFCTVENCCNHRQWCDLCVFVTLCARDR